MLEDDIVETEIETPLEEKYREQMRQIISQKIELPISTLPEMIEKQINLNPAFQRRDRWDDERRSRFIESIIMNVPIPPVFLGEDEYGKYVVLDGRQRLTAVSEFLANAYKLRKLKVWGELNDSTFHDLERKKLDRALTRRFIPAVVILRESSTIVKYDVFDRLNTGGMIAETMEIRNAVYRGAFNTLIHDLSDNRLFRRLWDIPEDDEAREKDETYRRMDDLELVLRFFAVCEYDIMSLRFKDFLSEVMDQRNKLYKIDPGQASLDQRRFEWAVRNVSTVFGAEAFTRPPLNGGERSSKSAPLADAVMVALSDVDPANLSPNAARAIKQGFDRLYIENEQYRQATDRGTNGKGAIRTRIETAKKLVASVIATTKEA